MLNQVNVAGRIGYKETKETKNGKAFLRLRIAIPEYRKDPNGEQSQEITHWIEARIFGREKLRSKLSSADKGLHVTIAGQLRTYQVHKEGEEYPRDRFYIIVDSVDFDPSAKQLQAVASQSSNQGEAIDF